MLPAETADEEHREEAAEPAVRQLLGYEVGEYDLHDAEEDREHAALSRGSQPAPAEEEVEYDR